MAEPYERNKHQQATTKNLAEIDERYKFIGCRRGFGRALGLNPACKSDTVITVVKKVTAASNGSMNAIHRTSSAGTCRRTYPTAGVPTRALCPWVRECLDRARRPSSLARGKGG